MKIACLSYRGLSHQGIEDAVRYMFPHADIFSVYPQHLRRHVLASYDILILPGINDEDSIYPTLLPPEKISILKDTIEQDGLVLWTFCASSYYMFEEISYQKRNGFFKKAKGSGLIKGQAIHGFRHVTRQRIPSDPKSDYVLASIRFDNQQEIFRVLNINGPSLYPASEERNLTRSFMHYTHVNGAAGVIKKIGNGLIMALGVHPELSSIHSLLPDSFGSYESDRWSILDRIKGLFIEHYERHKPQLVYSINMVHNKR